MTYTSRFENNFLDLATFVVMAPLQLVHALLWLAWQGCKAIAPYRKALACGALFGLFLCVCWALPALPLGLAITIVVGLVTYPRKAVK
jgi:hypothetical protein